MTTYADAITKPPRTLTELEQKLLLKTTGEHRDGFRDHVIISLALGTGLRGFGGPRNLGDIIEAFMSWSYVKP